jgi:hypothetical protein
MIFLGRYGTDLLEKGAARDRWLDGKKIGA